MPGERVAVGRNLWRSDRNVGMVRAMPARRPRKTPRSPTRPSGHANPRRWLRWSALAAAVSVAFLAGLVIDTSAFLELVWACLAGYLGLWEPRRGYRLLLTVKAQQAKGRTEAPDAVRGAYDNDGVCQINGLGKGDAGIRFPRGGRRMARATCHGVGAAAPR